MKHCKECSRQFPDDHFRAVSYTTKSGELKTALENTCRSCRNENLKAWKAKQRDRVNAQERERYSRNRDEILARNRAKFAAIYSDPVAHAELKEKRRRYRSLNPEYRHNKLTPETCFNKYLAAAKKRGLSFDLDLQLFIENWGGSCWYCGDDIATIGWDRVDSGRGYTSDNVTICCKACNFMKSATGKDEFLSRVFRIAAKHGN